MKRPVPIFLILIALISGAISFCLLTRGHTWLDDFASYLMQAKSILDGTMGDFVRRNAFTVNTSSYPPGPAAYPWGFPLLLAPLMALFGVNTLAFKLVNTVFYVLFLFVLFALARTRLKDGAALLVTAIFAFNPTLLIAHDQIISDIPFLFFCTLSIFLLQETQDGVIEKKPSPWRMLATGASIFAASFIRTNGILLLIPLALGWLLRRDPKGLRMLTPYLTFGILFAAQALIFPNGQDSYLSHFSLFTAQGLWDNFIYYLWLPSWLFREIPGGDALYPVLIIFVIISISLRSKRDWPVHLYSLATIALYVLWPERQGLRFIYPTLPFLLIFAFDGLDLTLARLKTGWQKPAQLARTGFWLLLILVSFGVSVSAAITNLAADRATNGPFDPVSAQMFEFLREKTPAQSIIIFFRPRALRLLTNRDTFMTERCADLPKGDYLALSKKVGDNGQLPLQDVTECKEVTLNQVFGNKRFVVYKINKQRASGEIALTLFVFNEKTSRLPQMHRHNHVQKVIIPHRAHHAGRVGGGCFDDHVGGFNHFEHFT